MSESKRLGCKNIITYKLKCQVHEKTWTYRSSVWTLAVGICLKSYSVLNHMKRNTAVHKCYTTCPWAPASPQQEQWLMCTGPRQTAQPWQGSPGSAVLTLVDCSHFLAFTTWFYQCWRNSQSSDLIISAHWGNSPVFYLACGEGTN